MLRSTFNKKQSTLAIALIWIAIAIPMASAGSSSVRVDSAKRAFRINDLYREQNLRYHNEWSIAADGSLAVVVSRAPRAGGSWRVKNADIWVRSGPSDPLVNMTGGERDDSDWSDPLWSPDGSRLLAVSTRGSVYSLWLWERATRIWRQVLDRPMRAGAGLYGNLEAYFEWIDDRHVIAMVLPEQVQVKRQGLEEPRPMASAKAGWARYLAGESSASVLETGGEVSESPMPHEANPHDMRQLVRVDVDDGTIIAITRSYRPATYNFYKPVLSPDGRFVAVLVRGTRSGSNYEKVDGVLDVTVHRTDGQDVSFLGEFPGDVLPGTPVWSADGQELAFFASGTSREQPPKLVRLSAADGRVDVRDTGDVIAAHVRDGQWDWTRLEWTEAGDLVVLAGQGDQALEKYARRDWWLIPRTGALRNLTRDLASVPVLKRLSFAAPLVGVTGDRVWKLDSETGDVQPVTRAGTFQARKIVWPQTDDAALHSGGRRRFLIERESRLSDGTIIVSNGDRTAPAYASIDIFTGSVRTLKSPGVGLSLARLSPRADTAFWVDAMFDASSVWQTEVMQPERAGRRLVGLNQWQSSVISPPARIIHYTSLYGDASSAWLQLPAGYRTDRRYPLIVNIYPGQSARPRPIDAYSRIAAAAGYIVMYPQMGPDNGRQYGRMTRDPYFEVSSGVLPAIDKAVELGIADPDRLFVEGLSMGGFATYSIIQQTHRFRAALAMAGISNWMNGSFSSRGRYGNDLAWMNIGWESENIQQRPATQTPWNDLGLYLRNSPIFYAERIETPLLIVHGDQDDNVPMSHSEEMFSAMVQLKKRASFVRYWGEGHAIESPANVRDLWQRRLAWFDEFGDIIRDERGNIVFDGTSARSRGDVAALKPEDFATFDLFR